MILEGMFAVCGVAPADFKTVCSSIDKLDKVEWSVVREELVKEKFVPVQVADRLEKFVRIRGNSFFMSTFIKRKFKSSKSTVTRLSLF